MMGVVSPPWLWSTVGTVCAALYAALHFGSPCDPFREGATDAYIQGTVSPKSIRKRDMFGAMASISGQSDQLIENGACWKSDCILLLQKITARHGRT